ncbi:kinesin-like protein KIN-12C [Aristolochia californica]|uniref:kinesin-like protein KIN-12C n=1 Tax=Aristolochia californica TaxID=171875 RepID=UPI0035D9D13B
MKPSVEIRRSRLSRSDSSQSLPHGQPKSVADKLKKMNFVLRRSKSGTENVNPNVRSDRSVLSSVDGKGFGKLSLLSEHSIRSDGQEDRPAVSPDSFVKVIARIRPVGGHEKEEDLIVKKVSSNSLSVGDRRFNFDAVVDSNTTQEEMFQLVGVTLVADSLAGFNTSILSYGQTGSGKTYTLWGPPSAMVEGCSSSSYQGLVPRIFNMLFSEIQKQHGNSEERLTNYHCRCSFLEIYNEQITDLLDPTMRNLQVKDDAKIGFYIENLTEEYVTDLDDVTLLLIKGLSNRKVGATSTNSKSSRSHIVFSCVIESWTKGIASRYICSSKSSRISFIDLAGSEKNKLEDASRECVKEARNVNRSISRLGKLINVLADNAHSEKNPDVPYRESCLTHLLRESLGGNTKLTVICAISPSGRCKGETLSTLRFGQRVQLVQNKAVVNEITEDDVNDLGDQIRQLKEELIRAKSNGITSLSHDSRHFKRHNARESLNQLRVSLNRSLILPQIENNDFEEEINVDEGDINELCFQLQSLQKDEAKDISENKIGQLSTTSEETLDIATNVDITEKTSSCNQEPSSCLLQDSGKVEKLEVPSICAGSSFLQDPALCESPKIKDNHRRSTVTSMSNLSSSKISVDARQSVKRCDPLCLSLRSSQILSGPTESLAASLHRGLQIIDQHQKNSSSKKTADVFAFGDFTTSSLLKIDKTDVGVQTSEEMGRSSDGSGIFLCVSCKQKKTDNDQNQVQESLNMWIVPADDDTETTSKAAGSALKAALERDLEVLVAEQAAKIEELNSQVEHYKQGEVRNSVNRNEKTRLLTQGDLQYGDRVTPTNEIDLVSQAEENNASFDMREREELLEEIESLKKQLREISDPSSVDSTETRETTGSNNTTAEFEKERQRWTEMESRWICLTEELRVDLESNRQVAEKMQRELKSEKKSSEELDDALQRSILGHAKMIEHYTELQEKYNDLLWKHRKIMEGIAEVKRTAAKIGSKGARSCFVESLAAELSALRVEREKEREYLKKENKGLRIQLKDTAEAVHAAGELLVRLREAEEAASIAEEGNKKGKQEIERMRKQMEKLKRKHAMEISTMKHYLADSRLPESAIRPIFGQDNDKTETKTYEYADEDDWRSEFGPSYRDY